MVVIGEGFTQVTFFFNCLGLILTQKHTQNYSSLLPNFFNHIVLPHFFAFFCCFRHQVRSPRYDTISVAPALSHSDASLSYYCQSHRVRALIDTIFASPGSLYRGVEVVADGEGSRCCCFSMATATLCTFSPSMPLGHSRQQTGLTPVTVVFNLHDAVVFSHTPFLRVQRALPRSSIARHFARPLAKSTTPPSLWRELSFHNLHQITIKPFFLAFSRKTPRNARPVFTVSGKLRNFSVPKAH